MTNTTPETPTESTPEPEAQSADTAGPNLAETAEASGPNLIVDYALLLKPRVMSLVVFTALVGLLLAPGEMELWRAALSVLCIAVGAGSSWIAPATGPFRLDA